MPRTAFMAARRQKYMTSPCTISRGGIQVAATMCEVARDTRQLMIIPGQPLNAETRWILRFPLGTVVHVGDRVAALGQSYTVLETTSPTSIQTVVQVYASKLGAATDDPGTPGVDETAEFLHANATIQLKRRNGTVVYASRAVRLDVTSTQEQIDPFGEKVDALLFDQPNSDYRSGDIVTVLSMSGHTTLEGASVFSAKTPTLVSDPDAMIRVPLRGSGR